MFHFWKKIKESWKKIITIVLGITLILLGFLDILCGWTYLICSASSRAVGEILVQKSVPQSSNPKTQVFQEEIRKISLMFLGTGCLFLFLGPPMLLAGMAMCRKLWPSFCISLASIQIVAEIISCIAMGRVGLWNLIASFIVIIAIFWLFLTLWIDKDAMQKSSA